ncbi:carboxypeptidase-like regulatory domain-containing protein [Streptomyces sp. NPDC004788]
MPLLAGKSRASYSGSPPGRAPVDFLEPVEPLGAVGCRGAVHGVRGGAGGYLRTRRAALLLVLAAVLAGCGPTSTTHPGVSAGGTDPGTVWGQVTLWPRVGGPVTANSPGPGRPLPGARVDFTRTGGGGGPEVATADGEGRYRIRLAAGAYTVRVENRVFNVSDPGATRQVTVRPGETVRLDLVLDSGLR